MAPDPSPRAIGTERGCVEDQPQRVGSSKASGACSVLRLVEDDTAALRSNSADSTGALRVSMSLVGGKSFPAGFRREIGTETTNDDFHTP